MAYRLDSSNGTLVETRLVKHSDPTSGYLKNENGADIVARRIWGAAEIRDLAMAILDSTALPEEEYESIATEYTTVDYEPCGQVSEF